MILLPLVCAKLQAVIGAGAAGLVAIRELRKYGHEVVAFEQSSQIGGVWVYSDDIETEDLLGKLCWPPPWVKAIIRVFWQITPI